MTISGLDIKEDTQQGKIVVRLEHVDTVTFDQEEVISGLIYPGADTYPDASVYPAA